MNGISAEPPASSAQRALLRLLTTALADDGKARRAIHEALVEARESSLPIDSVELLEFVKAYLVPHMQREVGPKLVAAMLEDLEALIEHEKAGDSSSRMAISTRMPPPGEQAPPEIEFPRDAPPPDLEPMPPPKRVEMSESRPVVILLDTDRFGRAALARALVQGRCDVQVLDSPAEVVEVLRGNAPVHVLLTEIDGLELDAIFAALVETRPELPVIVRTKSPRSVAEHLLRTAGVANFDVIAKSSKNTEVIELVRTLSGC